MGRFFCFLRKEDTSWGQEIQTEFQVDSGKGGRDDCVLAEEQDRSVEAGSI